MLKKSVAYLSVLVVICQSVPASVKVLPFVDSSAPIKFREVIAEPAPKVPSNLVSYAFAVDFSASASLNQLQIIKGSAYSAVFIQVYNSSGEGYFVTNACSSIRNAYNAGLGTEIYMTPQPASSKQGYQQLDEIYQGLSNQGIAVRSIWIQITSPTNWYGSATYNIYFINSIVTRASNYGMTVGIYTSYYDWNQITNGWSSIGDDVLLWYWDVFGGGVNDETPANFDDFRPFGGWTAPSVKQFAQNEQLSSITVNRNVYVAISMPKANDAVKDGKIYAGGFIVRNN